MERTAGTASREEDRKRESARARNGLNGGSELMRLLSRGPGEMRKSDWTPEKIIKRVIRASFVQSAAPQWP